MKQLFIGLLAMLFLTACGGEQNLADTNDENQEQSGDQTNETEGSVDDFLSGTWMDFETGEVMVFFENEVYWAKQPGIAFSSLGTKSKTDGKVQLYFEGKPDQLFEMVFDLNEKKQMECLQKGTKLNNYEKVCGNVEPAKAFEQLRGAIGYIDDAPMKYGAHNQLKTTDDPRMLMLYLHTPFKHWVSYSDEKALAEANFTKSYGAIKLKLKNGKTLALVGGPAGGDMEWPCTYATFSLDESYLDNQSNHLQHHWKTQKCENPDFWQIKKMYLDENNGDLLVDLEIKDVFDDFDEMDNGRAAEEGRPQRGKETLLITKTIRLNGDASSDGNIKEEHVKKKKL